jgi:2-dehydro-3-deoxy-D-arabinonate dehydratase
MRLAKVQLADGERRVAAWEDDELRLLDLAQVDNVLTLADILHAPDALGLAKFLVDQQAAPVASGSVRVLPPVDHQEVWAAGVTYKRSQVARMEESETGASHYDRVYTADRPELFYKASARRVVGPGEAVRVRADSTWSVPEPELSLVIAPDLRIVGYTIGNDMSARDIEGENPLYLPQAKVYDQCCALGPCVRLVDPSAPLDRAGTAIALVIRRGGHEEFRGRTDLGQMARGFEDLAAWLGREYAFPDGAILLTGTGIVPPDEFTLADGDEVQIEISGIGTLTNPVVQGR